MDAFVGAVKAGAHAIETDVHLSQDGVVVLSHVGEGDCGSRRPSTDPKHNRMQHLNDVSVLKRR